jgi:hypothetical protein
LPPDYVIRKGSKRRASIAPDDTGFSMKVQLSYTGPEARNKLKEGYREMPVIEKPVNYHTAKYLADESYQWLYAFSCP